MASRTENTAIFHSDAFREIGGEKVKRERNGALRELSKMIEENNGTDPSDEYFKNEFLRYSHFDKKVTELNEQVRQKYGGSHEDLEKLNELIAKHPKDTVSRARLIRKIKDQHSKLQQILSDLEENKFETALDYVCKRQEDYSGIMEGLYVKASELIEKYKTKTDPSVSRLEALRKIVEMGASPETAKKVSREDLKEAERLELDITEWSNLPTIRKILELKQTIRS